MALSGVRWRVQIRDPQAGYHTLREEIAAMPGWGVLISGETGQEAQPAPERGLTPVALTSLCMSTFMVADESYMTYSHLQI